MNKIYELIIIGSGPAGLAAALYAGRAELDTIIIEKAPISGGQIINTYEVDNYPGIPGISGFELGTKFREHCDRLNMNFITGEVTKFEVEDGLKKITLEDGTVYISKTVILANGANPRKLAVEGEERLAGMGVSYCATCDGAFFKNKVTVVVGGGDVAVEDAIFLARICKKVYVIHRRNEFRAARSYINKLLSMENVEIIWDSVVEEIKGNEQVENIIVKNIKSEDNKELEVDGVFIAVGNLPNSQVYKGVVEMDAGGYLVASENCETNIPGVFAAGDIRTKELRQIITAASDGANSITAVEKYLNTLS
ncbi:thioredoxin reductase [Anaerocolumna cellulosilytica]|uniref:Thioredoxin reductase n=1 Tax=Anaerocolumna cellulosilytica TaxID=433286 RepID=A0A6S6R155_9FIRM|nr:thioredoxin-disulfide reductase [Anaerocolumna cellulosilytica]MBB5195162.1 thioredoxin reductase (NADPH) [Anaerocolumna cellulosilytica]BCJ96634.1 thioredoxin reductase [Anaerocolumna cellulosilytica]